MAIRTIMGAHIANDLLHHQFGFLRVYSQAEQVQYELYDKKKELRTILEVAGCL